MKHQPAALRFLGATDTVTGSRYLLEAGGRRVLLDCGLFQGYKRSRERNRAPFPVPPDSIDAVVLTHAHLDHTGYVPALVRDGFGGPVYATDRTTDLCKLLLPDSGYLQEEAARFAMHRGSSSHSPALPLYTAADAVRSLNSFEIQGFDSPLDLGGGLELTFLPAGRILGAAQVHVRIGSSSLHITGDLGRTDDPLMYPPRPLGHADVLVTESTYGNRKHPASKPEDELRDIINRVAKRGGVVMFAAFAVSRAESLMLHLSRLRRKNAIVLSGYQAAGTRGATLPAGARELRIYGEDPRMTYITHGEPEASDALRLRIRRELGWRARVPEHLETVSLEDPR